MSQPKELIKPERILELARMISICANDLNHIGNAMESNRFEGIRMDGWPTIVRGLMFFHSQAQKIVNADSETMSLDFESLLLPGQSVASIKRQRPKTSPKKEAKSVAKRVKAKRNDHKG